MPADTFSTILGYLVMGTGNDSNTWGTNLNAQVFTQLESAIAGLVTHAVVGGTLDLSTTPPPIGPTLAMQNIQQFAGVLGSNQIVVLPNLSKTWLVFNGCTMNGHTLTFKTPGGTPSPAIPTGGICVLFCDGANNIGVGLNSTLRDVQWLGADGTLAAPGISFTNEPGTGIRRAGAGDLRLTVLGADIASFATNITRALFLATTTSAVALVNGLNSNISLSAKSGRVRITGPSAGFSIGGFTLPADGVRLSVYNSVAQPMTIVNNDGSSTAANRILTLTGANVTLRSGVSFATFSYDSTDLRWILESTN